ncbi:MAG: Stp1/IreP family PP2C-type Ser/Thr phosphatase [Cytophagales bacterium]|nr:Stp1/IreP family PP2C-type Ser/Thr phosphatase [Cytophagales bacterium]
MHKRKIGYLIAILYQLLVFGVVSGQEIPNEKEGPFEVNSTQHRLNEARVVRPEVEVPKTDLIIKIPMLGLDTTLTLIQLIERQHEIKMISYSNGDSLVLESLRNNYFFVRTDKLTENSEAEGPDEFIEDLMPFIRKYQTPILIAGIALILLILTLIVVSRHHMKKKTKLTKDEEDQEINSSVIPTGHRLGNATHVGQVRKANEDYYGSQETRNGELYLVCDGMGGHVGGAKAAQLAVETICAYMDKKVFQDPRVGLYESIIAANEAIIRYARNYPKFKGMGATCVAILIKGLNVYYSHVGDSRIYLLSKRRLERLTKDHSFVQTLVDKGIISSEEAEQHPRKNEITRALGIKENIEPELASNPIPAKRGDSFLLCSDGLTGVVGDARIERVLKKEGTEQEKANKLIEMANRGGGPDNITVQIITFS